MKALTWNKLTEVQKNEIREQFKGWSEEKIMQAKWEQSTHSLGQGKIYTSWSADFNTKIKIK